MVGSPKAGSPKAETPKAFADGGIELDMSKDNAMYVTPGEKTHLHRGKLRPARPPSVRNRVGTGVSTRAPSRDYRLASTGSQSLWDSDNGVQTDDWQRDGVGKVASPEIRAPAGGTLDRRMVVAMIDEELAVARPSLENQSLTVVKLNEDLKNAQKNELREARDRKMNNAERLARRQKVTSRLQASVRGWLVRKRVIEALDHRAGHNLAMAAMLPGQLKSNLRQLQHGTHDLLYREEDRVAGAVKLQAWWRGIVARRVVKVMRVSQIMQGIVSQMAAAATLVQARYRGATMYRKWRSEIRHRIELTRQQQFREMEVGMRCIIQIQRGVRSKQARKRLEEARAKLAAASLEMLERGSPIPSGATGAEEDEERTFIDTWRPVGAPGSDPAGCGCAGVILRDLPRHDWEVEKQEQANLVPFYGATREQGLRHQIGGHSAAMMQRQMATSGLGDEESGNFDDVGSVGAVGALHRMLGDTWEIYPSGLTPGFLPGLDCDVQERGGRTESYSRSVKVRNSRRTLLPSTQAKQLDWENRPCTKILTQPPSNARRRARTREDRNERNYTSGIDPHTLLFNAPEMPRGPTQLDDADEGSWSPLKVAHAPSYRKKRRPRGTEDEEQQWNTLGAPSGIYDARKHRPGEVSHERVWHIAHSLAEQLPAITAG